MTTHNTDAQDQSKTEATPPTQKPKKEKKEKAPKPPKEKKQTRETFLVAKFKEGVTNVEELAKLMAAEIESGKLRVRPSLRKMEVSDSMWVAQVKWYLHQAKRKNLIEGEVIAPKKPRAKKEKPTKADATPATAEEQSESAPEAAASTEDVGVL